MIHKGDIVWIISAQTTGTVIRVNKTTCRLLIGNVKKSYFKTDLIRMF